MKIVLILFSLFFLSNASFGEERFCFSDEEPNKLWISGYQVLGDPIYGPYVLDEDSIDRCFEGEIPRLVALSRVMWSMPHICRESRACAYDMDNDNVVGLDDVGSLIVDAMSYLNSVCRE